MPFPGYGIPWNYLVTLAPNVLSNLGNKVLSPCEMAFPEGKIPTFKWGKGRTGDTRQGELLTIDGGHGHSIM